MPKAYEKKRKFPKIEGNFVRDFMKEFVKIAGEECMWYFKSHGEPMQTRGIPDIIMCYKGLFVGMEFKIMRHGKVEPTPYQEYNLDCIKKAHGFGMIVWWDEANGNCGINLQRFDNLKKCVEYLIELFDTWAEYPPAQFSKLRRNEGNEKDFQTV